MARNTTAKSKSNAAQPTVAIRLATLFDENKAKLARDMRRPVESSRSKQIGIVGGLIGVGAALGVALS